MEDGGEGGGEGRERWVHGEVNGEGEEKERDRKVRGKKGK